MDTNKAIHKAIEIDTEDYKILKNVLEKYPYKFYAYGSRVKGKARRYSDLDIYSMEKMEGNDLINLKWDLEDSDITIKVDVIDPSRCSEEFKELIKEDLVEIK
ncbi:MAG: nucleotidyltransferase domain-containing protein [Rickettsiales bacterium]|jgi:predicted nucleotidyltransferase|nr:nucleotidyltransferase domain-containing protein [Rickettsiales bacterium]